VCERMRSKSCSGVTKTSAILIILVIIFAALAVAGWTVAPTLAPAKTVTTAKTITVTSTVGAGTVTKTVTSTVVSTVTATAAPKKKLVVRAVFQTPVSEPWDGAIHQAILKVAEEFRKKGIEVDYKFVDRRIDPKDYELALRDAAKVADIVFLDAFLKEDIARKVAKDFPDVAFAAGSEYLPTPPNFAVFDNSRLPSGDNRWKDH